MKCEVYRDDRWPTLSLDSIGSKAKDDPDLVDVPPKLLNAVQKAERDLATAELAVLDHLEQTGQLAERHREWLDVLRGEVGR